MGTLEQDYLTVPGQLYACISFVGPDQPQKNEKLGMKIRGCFASRDEASSHAKRLQKEDALVDIYVVDMYKWLLIPPDREQISDVHYQNEKLEEIMTKYRENQSQAAAMFEKRKRDMMAKPQPGPYPYIDPADENSKFYTKPDVPPIPHPAEIVEELRKEFPDKTVAELVAMADERVNKIIEERRLPAVQIESIAEGDESPVPEELSPPTGAPATQTPTGDDEVPDQPAAAA